MPPLSKELVRNIRLAHVDQLAQQEPPTLGDIERETPIPAHFDSTISWVTANPGALKAAQDTQCDSAAPNKPNWDAVFFSIIESSAMYLRKPAKMAEAIRLARAGDHEGAVQAINDAQEDIDAVAKAIDCTFVQLCDFSQQSPDGTWYHSGAFCGLFISNDSQKPFMGLAFKGSNSKRDAVTDLDWSPIAPLIPGVAWGALVDGGFYKGLFGQFTVKNGVQIPFDLIRDGVAQVYREHKGARLHFTGHSLGGAYCTLNYGEFLRQQSQSPFSNFNFGDMYSLAAPRVALEPFAQQVNQLTPPGKGKYLFRIVNQDDPVPTVPPRTKDQLTEYPFIHVGGAWELTDSGPGKMADEPPPVDPQTIVDILWNIKNHMLSDYYGRWQKTPHS